MLPRFPREFSGGSRSLTRPALSSTLYPQTRLFVDGSRPLRIILGQLIKLLNAIKRFRSSFPADKIPK